MSGTEEHTGPPRLKAHISYPLDDAARASFLDRILAASVGGIYLYDMKLGRNRFINPRFTQITGWDYDTMQAMTHEQLIALVHPDDRPRLLEHLTRVAECRDDEIFELEYRLATRGGGWIWCMARDSVFERDSDGTPCCMIGTVLDITERKHLEERLRATVESAPTAMVMIDKDGRIVQVNAEAEKLFGYTRPELLSMTIESLVPTRYRADHPRVREDFFSSPEARRVGGGRDLYGLRRDGTEFPIEIGLNPIRTEEGLFVISALVDISERKRLEERFRASVESAPTAMVMVDGKGRIVLVNAETEKLFGYPRDELLGSLIEILVPGRFRPDHPRSRDAFFAHPEARRMGAGRDLFGLRRDGSEFPVEIGLSPIDTHEGTFVVSAIVDITERKRLESEQAKLYRELTAANDALTQSNMDLQQFAYIASHDLQAPLRHISGFVQLLRDRYQGQLDPKADGWIDHTVHGVERMQTLIQNLLTFSRVESRSRPFQRIPLETAFNDAVELLRASIEESGAVVTRDELPYVDGDASQMAQLLENLIGNAIKYHGKEPPRVHVSVQRQGDDWIVSIRDNGIGISPKHHERIFEIFRRLHTQQEYPGTGIGLAVCRRIVARHGGRIWVESEQGSGADFRFTLPVASPPNP